MLDKELLRRIITSPESSTGRLVAARRKPGAGPLEPGFWYSGFTRVRTEAEKRNLPFFAAWTNGDLCGFCRRFSENVLSPVFTSWMRESNCLFWLGGSMDETDDDRKGGLGYTWCMGTAGDVHYYPFVSFVQRSGNSDVFRYHASGHDYDARKLPPDGASAIIRKLSEIRSAAVQTPTVTEETCPRAESVLHIRFNPEWDAEHVVRFQHALRANGGHCPCRAEKTADSLCMCKWFLEQNTPGRCHCGAFEKYKV